jgi:hypothetical protein
MWLIAPQIVTADTSSARNFSAKSVSLKAFGKFFGVIDSEP